MSKEDWIILRLLMVFIRSGAPMTSRAGLDVTEAIRHIMKKYGEKEMHRCVDQIRAEYQDSYIPKQTRQ